MLEPSEKASSLYEAQLTRHIATIEYKRRLDFFLYTGDSSRRVFRLALWLQCMLCASALWLAWWMKCAMFLSAFFVGAAMALLVADMHRSMLETSRKLSELSEQLGLGVVYSPIDRTLRALQWWVWAFPVVDLISLGVALALHYEWLTFGTAQILPILGRK